MIPRVSRTDVLQSSNRDGRVLQAVQYLSYTTEHLRTLAISQVDLLYDSQNIDLCHYARLYNFPAGITFRGCVVTLSATCPVMVFFMRYVSSIAMMPVNIYVFDNLRKIHTMLKDELEVQILMKYVNCSTYIISIFLCVCCSWTIFTASYVFVPITLDLLLPLNESRRRYFSYLTMFSHDRMEYVDIVYVNILVVYTIGLLCIAGTELMLTVFSHWMCGMFEIISYRLRKTIAGLSSSKQIDPNFKDFRYVVDCHRSTLQLVHLTIMSIRWYISKLILLCFPCISC
ncbi:uncharacterized protein LOC122566854 [Bombus pyrosoma]|uniref:uncharacterized protein LOC122566854 n=1 Tax=Bombus pyrosoma TaxID=396416 RepID=UPI001CB98505|nr:uncharacterized protein LOC122566854 [Bombus pyrosoma]